MNELRRMAYLEAMGIDSYISRKPLPGAAATRRLAIVRAGPQPGPEVTPGAAAVIPVRPLDSPRQVPVELPRIDSARPSPPPAPVAASVAPGVDGPRFSLAAMICGGCLWLEDLEGKPLAQEQVQLVRAMARALEHRIDRGISAAEKGDPGVTVFNWPVHNNRQLDLGEEAARAAVAGFIGRNLEQGHCRALVLLGKRCLSRVPVKDLGDIPVVTTCSSAQLLAEPALKKQAWQDLLILSRSP